MADTQEPHGETIPDTPLSPPEFVGGTADARAYRRRSVLWPAQLMVGEHELKCQIWNMSLGGARIRLAMPLKDGAEVTLVIAGRGAIPATVRWCQNGAAGLMFALPAEEVRVLFMDRLHALGLDGVPQPPSS